MPEQHDEQQATDGLVPATPDHAKEDSFPLLALAPDLQRHILLSLNDLPAIRSLLSCCRQLHSLGTSPELQCAWLLAWRRNQHPLHLSARSGKAQLIRCLLDQKLPSSEWKQPYRTASTCTASLDSALEDSTVQQDGQSSHEQAASPPEPDGGSADPCLTDRHNSEDIAALDQLGSMMDTAAAAVAALTSTHSNKHAAPPHAMALAVLQTLGHLPLHVAACSGNVEAIQVLAEACPALLDAPPRRTAAWASLTPHLTPTALRSLPSPHTAALHLAIIVGHEAAVLELLRQGANPDACPGPGTLADTPWSPTADWPPVFGAVLRNQEPITRLLLAGGANPQVVHNGRPVLHSAVQSASPQVVAAFLQAGANPNTRGLGGAAALHIVAQREVAEVAARAVTRRSQAGGQAISALEGPMPVHLPSLSDGVAETAAAGRSEAAGEAPLGLACGPVLECEGRLRSPAPGSCCAVECAGGEAVAPCGVGQEDGGDGEVAEMVWLLLGAGADLGQRMHDGHTPLHLAAHQGAVTTLKALLRCLKTRSSQPNLEHPEDCLHQHPTTPLDQALLDLQLSPTGQSALHLAVQRGHVEAVQVLLQAGASLELRAADGCTALHMAVDHGALPVLQALLGAGADPNARGADGSTPLHEAAWRGHTDMVTALLGAGADPNLMTWGAEEGDAGEGDDVGSRLVQEQRAPLHLAAWRGHAECVEALLLGGADVELASGGGMTAAHMARQQRRRNVLAILSRTCARQQHEA